VTGRGRLHVERRADVVCIAVDGDLANRDELLERVLAAANGARRLVLDLAAVVYLDSAGVRLVYEVSRELSRLGIDLAIVQPRAAYVARVLALSAVDDMVPVYASSDEAWGAD
jgi:anti-sigma B factor antagonist